MTTLSEQFRFLFSAVRAENIAEFFGCVFCGAAVGELGHTTTYREIHQRACKERQ